jgi:hemoglobin-like flavoprotein
MLSKMKVFRNPNYSAEITKIMTLNVELLESSFALVINQGSEFTTKFYAQLFADYPEVQPLFAGTQMEKQGVQLFQSLVFTVNNLRDLDTLIKALKGLGTRHVKYGVLPKHYPMVGSTLLKTFEAKLGSHWTLDVQQAWIDAYSVVAQVMLDGADYPPESLNLP